jgi:hypothetical protein
VPQQVVSQQLCINARLSREAAAAAAACTAVLHLTTVLLYCNPSQYCCTAAHPSTAVLQSIPVLLYCGSLLYCCCQPYCHIQQLFIAARGANEAAAHWCPIN